MIKDVCMHTVVCTVQGSLFVQHFFHKKGISYSFFFFFKPVRATTLMSMYKINV